MRSPHLPNGLCQTWRTLGDLTRVSQRLPATGRIPHHTHKKSIFELEDHRLTITAALRCQTSRRPCRVSSRVGQRLVTELSQRSDRRRPTISARVTGPRPAVRGAQASGESALVAGAATGPVPVGRPTCGARTAGGHSAHLSAAARRMRLSAVRPVSDRQVFATSDKARLVCGGCPSGAVGSRSPPERDRGRGATEAGGHAGSAGPGGGTSTTAATPAICHPGGVRPLDTFDSTPCQRRMSMSQASRPTAFNSCLSMSKLARPLGCHRYSRMSQVSDDSANDPATCHEGCGAPLARHPPRRTAVRR